MRQAWDAPEGSMRGMFAGLGGALAIVVLMSTLLLDTWLDDPVLMITVGVVTGVAALAGSIAILLAHRKYGGDR